MPELDNANKVTNLLPFLLGNCQQRNIRSVYGKGPHLIVAIEDTVAKEGFAKTV